MKAVLVDDEQDNIDTLIWELKGQKTKVDVIETFTNSVEAFQYLQYNAPDVVFLDIEMPHMNGFELLAGLKEIPFKVVFVTAFNEYAIEAFKHNAIDYLLKPVMEEDLAKALEKVSIVRGKHEINIVQKLNQFFTESKVQKKMPIVGKTSIVLLVPKNIVYCESDGNYTTIHYKKHGEMKRIVSSKTLKYYEESLDSDIFIKTHRSFLVNKSNITELHSDDGRSFLMLDDLIEIPIARSKKEDVFGLYT